MNESRIHQEISLPLTPQRIYDALTDAEQFSGMSGGAPTEIEATDGGAFSCFGGMILGRQIEGVPGQRLVQAWRAKTWEPGQFSIARFELKPEGSGTRVIFQHTGFPDGQADHLSQGWHSNYWEPLRKLRADK
jgi:activator of HSP90 ATPase